MVYLRKGEGEVESLPQASEGDEGLAREAACGHLTVGLLILAVRTLAQESSHQQVHTPASVLTHPRNTPAWTCIHLTALSWKENTQDFTNLKNIFLLHISLLCNGNVSWMLKVLHGTIHVRTFIFKNIKNSHSSHAKWGNKPTFHASTETY